MLESGLHVCNQCISSKNAKLQFSYFNFVTSNLTTYFKAYLYRWPLKYLQNFSVPVFEHFGPGKKAEFEPATIGIGSANLPEDDSAELMALQLEVAEMAQEMTDKMSGMVTIILAQIFNLTDGLS